LKTIWSSSFYCKAKVTELAEGAAVSMARKDIEWAKKNGKEIFVQGTYDDPFLTSGAMIPFSESNIADQIENAAEFQGYATSGAILHHFIEDEINPEVLSDYLHALFISKPINYITLTNNLSVCNECKSRFYTNPENNGKALEDMSVCPDCGSDDISLYSRVIGYIKPVARKNLKNVSGRLDGEYTFWSNSRRRDFSSRKKLSLSDFTLNNSKTTE
jgi:ribonucleoside-triphosphate reductase